MNPWQRWALAAALALFAGCGGEAGTPPAAGTAEAELSPSDKLKRDLDAEAAQTKAANPAPARP